MTVSHDKLCQSKNVSASNCEPYLFGLVSEFMSSLGHAESHVEFQAQSAEVDLDLGNGTALGLIVTELVSVLRFSRP
jgi:two-component sensor histidine kinase